MALNQGRPLLSPEGFLAEELQVLPPDDSEPLRMACGHVEKCPVLEGQPGDEKPSQLGAQEVWRALPLPPVSVRP